MVFVNINPDITLEERDAVINGEITAGMTKEMVVASWGQPANVVSEILKGKNVVSWIYRQETDDFLNTYKVVFLNGSVRTLKLMNSRKINYRSTYQIKPDRNLKPRYREFQR